MSVSVMVAARVWAWLRTDSDQRSRFLKSVRQAERSVSEARLSGKGEGVWTRGIATVGGGRDVMVRRRRSKRYSSRYSSNHQKAVSICPPPLSFSLGIALELPTSLDSV